MFYSGMADDPAPTFIDLFAGIGGFHEALHGLGAKCKFVCERDPSARKTYEAFHRERLGDSFFANAEGIHHPAYFHLDITDLTLSVSDKRGNRGTKNIKKVMSSFKVDVLCGGFPCQPFSQAGKRLGFEDTRGTLFYDVCRIIHAKKPKAFFLENVRGIVNHGGEVKGVDGVSLPFGRTLSVILDSLFKPKSAGGLGYHPPGGRACKKRGKLCDREIAPGVYLVKASDHGLPQNRPRVFIIGFKSAREAKQMKIPSESPISVEENALAEVLDVKAVYMNAKRDKQRYVGFTLRCGGKRSPIDDRRNWDQYHVLTKEGVHDNLPLTPALGLKMMGFPVRKFPKGISESQAMKQLGNSVAVPAIRAWGKEMLVAMGFKPPLS